MINPMEDGLVAPNEAKGRWAKAAWDIGVNVAGPASNDVDEKARFPIESCDALRDGGFLSALLPLSLGGGGASLFEIVGAIRALAFHCAASALVLAMHSTEIVNLTRHGNSDGLRALAAEISEGQLLVANANSEVGLGGDLSRSACGLDTSSEPWTLDKQALAVSYGENADIIMTCARRSLTANGTDKVYVALRSADISLHPRSDWDTLGLRGTCSRGYAIHASIDESLIFPVPYSTIVNDGGGQASQLLLSAVWVGIAEAAASRAHSYVRSLARKSVGTVPTQAVRLAKLVAEVEEVRSLLASHSYEYEDCVKKGNLQSPRLSMGLRNLKVTSSETAVRVSTGALVVCGINGYQRNSPYSLDRLVRDAHGGLVMVSNDRYLNDNAQLLLVRKNI